MQTVPTTHPVTCDSFTPQNTGANRPLRVFTAADSEAARQARRAQLDKWATLSLKQNFADENFMLGQIKAAGMSSPNRSEPACPGRLRSLLARAGVYGIETKEALGTTLPGYLTLNPGLPLWAALALVLEATGRFTVTACGLSQGEGGIAT